MRTLNRIGIDAYMLLLLGAVILGVSLPVQAMAADALNQTTFSAVALLFFLYGAKLDSASVRAGLTNWRVQALTFAATYLLLPVTGLALVAIFDPFLRPTEIIGLLFLAVLPSTVQSSIAFTSIAGGNLPAAICAASVSNLAGVALTPALVALLLSTGDGSVNLSAVLKVGTQILLPFVIGQVVRPWVGATIQKHWMMTLAVDRGAILLIVYSAFSAGTVAGLWAATPLTALLELGGIVLLFFAAASSLMVCLGKLCGLPAADRAALFYCGSTKSLASGLPIASILFAPEMVGAIILPTMIYHMTQLLLCAYVSQKAARAVAI